MFFSTIGLIALLFGVTALLLAGCLLVLLLLRVLEERRDVVDTQRLQRAQQRMRTFDDDLRGE